MPHFKRVEFVAQNAADAVDKFTVSVEIRSNGTFYTHVPDKLRVSFNEDDIDVRERQRKGFFVTSALTFAELLKTIKKAHDEFMTPVITEEPVIVYNIESHVSFALTKDGRIFPNAGYPDASWINHHDKTYGNHDACHAPPGGYSLIVGARAMLKKTTTYGEKSATEYSNYYKGESHLRHENPAQLLNSWTAMNLPEDAREMPYSDEAAMFFFGLLQAMAELNRRVQEFTNTPAKLALAISRNAGILMLPLQKEPVKNKR